MELTPGEKSMIESSTPYIHIYTNIYKYETYIQIYTHMGLTPSEKSMIESSTLYMYMYTNIYKYGTHI